MEKLTLWLADENEHYLELMKRYIRTSNYKSKLNISTYTDLDCFKYSLEHIHHDAIVLVSALFLPICSELEKLTVIYLSEETNLKQVDQSNQVYKYRPLNQILDQVLNIYYARKNSFGVGIRSVVRENDTKVIAVYSASGGSGVTTLTQQLAEFYVSLGKKAFYLNLEPIHSMLPSSSDGIITRFTQVLYMLKSDQPLISKLDQLLQNEHLGHYDMFHPAKYQREWHEYEREDIELLLRALKQIGRYDLIMMDVGSSLTSTTLGALEHSDEIFWVIPDRAGSCAKVDYVKGELVRLSSQLHDQVWNRSKFVLQMYNSTQRMKQNSFYEFNTVLPFVMEWLDQAAGTPPALYRQALLRLLGAAKDGEMNQLGGYMEQSIHHST